MNIIATAPALASVSLSPARPSAPAPQERSTTIDAFVASPATAASTLAASASTSAASASTPAAVVGTPAASASAPAAGVSTPAASVSTPAAGATVHAANPWPELERMGYLASSTAVPGPLGLALGDTLQEELREVARRVERSGAQFEEKHGWLGAKLKGREYTPLSADAFVDKILDGGIQPKSGFTVSLERQDHAPLRCLADLQMLDAVHGMGPDAAGADAPVVRAVTSLEQQGWVLETRVWGPGGESDCRGAYASLSSMHEGGTAVASHPGAQAGSYWISRDNATLFDYLNGSGTDWGLPDPALATSLRDLADHHCALATEDGSWRGNGFWDFVSRGLPSTFRIGVEEGVKVLVTRSDLANLPALYNRIDEAQRLWTTYRCAGLERYADEFVDAATNASVAPYLGSEQRAEFLSKLVKADEEGGRPDLGQASTDLAALARSIPDAERLREQVEWYAGILGARREKWNGDRQGNALLRVRDQLRLEAGSPEEYAWLQGTLARIVADQGDVGRSLEALDVVRLAGGAGTPDERVDAFCRLARATSDEHKARVVSEFRVLAGQSLPGESLTQAFERYESLLRALVGDDRLRATEIFTEIQGRARAHGGAPEQADAQLARFLESLVHQSSIDVALLALRQDPSPDHPHAGEVRREDDGTLIIGGVRLSPRESA